MPVKRNHPYVFHGQTGATVVAKLYDVTNTLIGSYTMDELPASSGRYVLTEDQLSAVAAGQYDIRIEANGIFQVADVLNWNGSFEAQGLYDTRDFQEPMHLWRVAKRSDNVLYSPDVMRIAAGETLTGGFVFQETNVLGPRQFIGSSGEPTVSGDADITAAKKGHSARVATVYVTAAGGASEGDEAVVKVAITDAFGNGPFFVRGRVVVGDESP